jgi:hypothetical protein
MPLMRYFVFVSSVLLALLFIADACLPKLPTAGRKTDALPPIVRIYSDQKWPERVVYDTSVTMVRAAPAANPEAAGSAPPMIAVTSPKLREALAELPPQLANPKKPQQKFAKQHAVKPVWLAARRSPFGWFGPTIW